MTTWPTPEKVLADSISKDILSWRPSYHKNKFKVWEAKILNLKQQLRGWLKEGFVETGRGCLVLDLTDDDLVVGVVRVHEKQMSKKPQLPRDNHLSIKFYIAMLTLSKHFW